MGKKLRKLKKIRIHREGTTTLVISGVSLVLLNLLTFYAFGPWKVFCYVVLGVSIVFYAVVLNFFQCPVRRFEGDNERTVVASADGKVVVVEEVMEDEFFHEPRIMVSIFMSLFNVHNNWVPCDGRVKTVIHHNGRYKAAWLPKASTENERSSIIITTPEGQDILIRQVAGALARRIVTYLKPGEDCVVDEHLGFIKFGSRVDVYLPLDAKVQVEVGQKTTGNETVIATL